MSGRRRTSRRFLFIAAAVLGAFIPVWWFAPGTVQQRNMDRVAVYLETLEPLVRADHRLAGVLMHPYTPENGCLAIRGEIGSDAALEDLRAIVAAHPCPRPVLWGVRIVTPEERAERDEAPDDASRPPRRR